MHWPGHDEDWDGVGVGDGFTEVGAAEVGVLLGFVVLGAADVGVVVGRVHVGVLLGVRVGVVEADALGEVDTVTDALALPVGVIEIVGLELPVGVWDALPDGEPEPLGSPVGVPLSVGTPVGVGVSVGTPVGVGVSDGTGIVGPPLLSAGFGARLVDSDGLGVVTEDVGLGVVGAEVGFAGVVVGDVAGFVEVADEVGTGVVEDALGVFVGAALLGL